MRDTTPAPAHVVDSLQTRIGRSHFLRLLTALILAIGTWGWVSQVSDPIVRTTHTEIEIEPGELGDGLTMITSLPRGTVEIEGPRSEQSRTPRSSLSLELDTSEVTGPGDYNLPVVVNAPDSSSRISVEPRSVRVQVDELTTEVLPLEIERPDPETTTRVIGAIEPEVSQVTVTGPSVAVSRVTGVRLPVTITTQNTTFIEAFEPYAVDEHGQRVTEVSILPREVRTRVEMQSRGKVVSVIANVTGSPAEGYTAQQKNVFPANITVDGPPDVLQQLLFVNTEPVDVTGASQSVSQRVGLADLPPGVTVIEPSSGTVEVRVAIQDSSATSQTLSNLPVNALNTQPGYTVTIEPGTVDVVVLGPVSTIQEMTGEDITVVVDVRGLGPGTHSLTPFVALTNPNVRAEGTTPTTVSVTIEEQERATPQAEPAMPSLSTLDAIAYESRPGSRVRRCLT